MFVYLHHKKPTTKTMKTKIEIKSINGKILFEFEKEDNTVKGAVIEAVKSGTDLSRADLSGAYLSGAGLSCIKIKKIRIFTGLYKYVVFAFISEDDEKYIKLGCHTRKLSEWENDFWNNPYEFPNNGSEKSKLRVFAFETAKKWFEIIDND